MPNLLEKIHSKGYWRIVIRPTIFDKERIPTLTKCREIIDDAVVRLRGWDYPYFDNSQIINNVDSIAIGVEFMHHIEFWKFFQSSQFVHHFACYEDHLEKPKFPSYKMDTTSGKYLSILSTLYSITEIFQFISRLISKEILIPKVEVTIGLYDMKDRQLFFGEQSRYLRKAYISNIPEIIFNKTYISEQVLTSAAELAMEATIWVFERFNWLHYSKVIFPEEQKKFLEKRL